MGQSRAINYYIILLTVVTILGVSGVPGLNSSSNEIIDDSIQEFTFGLVQLSSATHVTPPTIFLNILDDSGFSDTDKITKTTELRLFGTTAAGTTVRVFDDTGGGAVFIGNADIDSVNWTFTTPTLAEGGHTFKAEAKHLGGDEIFSPILLSVTVDLTLPTFIAERTAVNTVLLTFIEAVSGSAISASFTVVGQTAATTNTAVAAGTAVTLSTTGLTATDGTPAVNYVAATGDIEDTAGNEVADGGAVLAADQVAPTFTAETLTLTTTRVTFSEPIANGNFVITDWTVDAGAVTGSSFIGVASGQTSFILTHATTGDTAATPTVAYTAGNLADASNNTIVSASPAAADGVAPVMVSAITATISTIDVTFSEDLKGTTVSAADFKVGGVAATGASESAGVVTLTAATFGTGDTPAIELVATAGGVDDPSNNTLASQAAPTTAATADGVPPTFTAIRSAVNTFDLTFSENVDSPLDDTARWTVAGASTIAGTTVVVNGLTMTITTTGFALTDTGGTPTITYVAAPEDSVFDKATVPNEMTIGENADAADQVPPLITSITPNNGDLANDPTPVPDTIADADAGEGIYEDTDGDNLIDPTEKRIANTPSDGTAVVALDPDDGKTLENFDNTVRFVDADGGTADTYDVGEKLYEDVNGNNFVDALDIRIAGHGIDDGSIVIALEDDDGDTLKNFANTVRYRDTIGTVDSFDAGTVVYAIAVAYSEKMDSNFNPSNTISDSFKTGLSATLINERGAWNSPTDTTYTFSYDIADTGVEVSDVDVTDVSGAKDVPGNTQVANSQADIVSADTQNPTIPSSTLTIFSDNTVDTISPGEVATEGDEVTIKLDADEILRGPVLTDIDFLFDDDSSNTRFRLQNTGDGDPTTDLSILIFERDMQPADKEGRIDFAIKYFDLVGNRGAPATAESPANATNAHITDTTSVIYDRTAPTGLTTVFGEIGSGDVSTVVGGDADDTDTLVNFADTVKFVDDRMTSGTLDAGERLYSDVNSNDIVDADDIRIAAHGFADAVSIVVALDADDGDVLVSFTNPVRFVDTGLAGYNGDDKIYEDVNDNNTVNADDIRLANHGPFAGTIFRPVELGVECDDSKAGTNGGDNTVAKCFRFITDTDDDGSFGDESFTLFTTEGVTADDLDQATLSKERGVKTLDVKIQDSAGNEASIPDDINLDAFINAYFAEPQASDSTPVWEDDAVTLTVIAKNTRVDDKLRFNYDYLPNEGALFKTFDFPDGYVFVDEPTQVDDTPITSDEDTREYSTNSRYPRPSQDAIDIPQFGTADEHKHTPSVTLLDSGNNVVSSSEGADIKRSTSNNVVVQERTTVLTIDPLLLDVFGENDFDVTGNLADSSQSLIPLPSKPIEYVGDGATVTLLDTTSDVGITISDDEVFAVTCPTSTCTVRLNARLTSGDVGSTITFDQGTLPGFVSFTLENMGDNTVEMLITDGDTPAGIELLTFDALSTGPVGWSIQNTINGISSIEITRILGPQPLVNNDKDCTIPVSPLRLGGLGVADGASDSCFDSFGVLRTDITGLEEDFNEDPVDLIPFDDDGDGETDEDDVEAIPDLSTSTTAGFSLFQVRAIEGTLTNVISFDTPEASISSKIFGVGNHASSGSSQTAAQAGLEVTARFDFTDVDPDYLGSSVTDFYDVFFTNNPGFGSGTAVIRADTNKGTIAYQCRPGDGIGEDPPGGGDQDGDGFLDEDPADGIDQDDMDLDGDGICDNWEGRALTLTSTGLPEPTGIPHIYGGKLRFLDISSLCADCAPDAGGNAINDDNDCRDSLGNKFGGPGIADGDSDSCFVGGGALKSGLTEMIDERDLYIELDAMFEDEPDPTALANVVAAFALGNVDVHFIEDDFNLFHNPIMNFWFDTDTDETNDFNRIKLRNYGIPAVQATIDGFANQINKIRVVDATKGQYQLEITNVKVTFPDDTKGGMTFKVTVQTGTTGSTIAHGIDTDMDSVLDTFASMPFIGGGFWNDKNPVERNITNKPTNVNHLFIFVDDFTTGKPFTTKLISPITIPFTVTPTTDKPLGCTGISAGSLCITDPLNNVGFPSIKTRLMDAYAQVVRYGLHGHSYGGPSGQSELRGNDYGVTLSAGFGSVVGDTHPNGNIEEQTGTIMHEIGHMLNLQHGGPKYLIDDTAQLALADTPINCKPNYMSIMSYGRQLQGTFLSGSEWVAEFSDGTHGGNPSDSNVDGTIRVAGGLDESALDETSSLPGSVKTMVWGTPTSGHGHSTHKHLSDSSGPGTPPSLASNEILSSGEIDWDDDQSISGTVSVDISNLGVSGCLASTGDPTYYDYDDFFHMDFNFRQGPSGQFDGLTAPITEGSSEQKWTAILASPITAFDGLEAPPNNDGSNVDKLRSIHHFKLQILDTQGGIQDVGDAGRMQVYVTRDFTNADSAVSFIGQTGADPENTWVQLLDNQDHSGSTSTVVQGDQSLALWRTDSRLLQLNWQSAKTPNQIEADFPGRPNHDPQGIWYIRVVLFDPTGDTAPGTGIAGAVNLAGNHLVDTIVPFIVDPTERSEITNKILLTKGGPGGEEDPTLQDEEIDDLIESIEAFVDSKDLKKGASKTIISTLQTAKQLFFDGSTIAACGELTAFDTQVDGLASNQISDSDPDARQALLDENQDIQDARC